MVTSKPAAAGPGSCSWGSGWADKARRPWQPQSRNPKALRQGGTATQENPELEWTPRSGTAMPPGQGQRAPGVWNVPLGCEGCGSFPEGSGGSSARLPARGFPGATAPGRRGRESTQACPCQRSDLPTPPGSELPGPEGALP